MTNGAAGPRAGRTRRASAIFARYPAVMDMRVEDLRVALFSGNYNYVKDGANQALNRLVGRLLERGAAVRVYSPTSDTPAFPPTGDLVSVPSIAFPGRGEYRLGLRLDRRVRDDLAAFGPHIVHLSAPDVLGHSAKTWGRAQGLPVVASVHTRFETYVDYYGFGFVRRLAERIQRRFYSDMDAVWAPSESMAEVLRAEGWAPHAGIWSRGVDRGQYNPGRRSLPWRRELGIADGGFVLGFVGRLVLGEGMRVTAAGVVLGLLGALAAALVLGAPLFEVSTTSPLVYVAVAALVATVALLASWLPARRATRVAPTLALRAE